MTGVAGSAAILPRGAALREALAAPRRARLEALVVRLGNDKHARPEVGHLTRAEGLVGDRWSAFRPVAARQLTLMDVRVVRMLLAARGDAPGMQGALIAHEALDLPGDNLVMDHATAIAALPPGTRLRIGGAVIETNHMPHMGCKKFEARFGSEALAWVNDEAHRDLCLRGIHAVVIDEGALRIGDSVTRLA